MAKAKTNQLTDRPTAELQAELENLINWFESEQADLDQALEQYQRGKELITELEARLKDVENKIISVTKIHED